ncbi:MAG: hypothetical protein ABJ325_16140 [Nitratireductor sp.]
MFGFFRRRSAAADAEAARLFAHVKRQLRASGQLDSGAVSPAAKSFWVHDYMMGLTIEAERAGRLRRTDSRRAFVDFMVNVMGLPLSAAQCCYATSRGHCRPNPKNEASLAGIADAEALLSGAIAQTPLLAQFRMPGENAEGSAAVILATDERPGDLKPLS